VLRYEFNLHYNLNLLLTNYCRFGSSCFRKKQLKTAVSVWYHTDQSGASGSYYIFFWSGVYNCMRIRFISAFCNLLTSSPPSSMGNTLAAGLRVTRCRVFFA